MFSPLRLLPILLVLLPAVGCKVTADAGYEVPPTVELKYRIRDGDSWIDVGGGASVTVSDNDTVHLYACATSPAGIGITMINGGGSTRCALPPTDTEPGSMKISPYAFYEENRSSASPGELTPETLIALASIPIHALCDEGVPGGAS